MNLHISDIPVQVDIHPSHHIMETRHQNEWELRKAELIRNAKFACDNAAASYRSFFVGTCVLGWSENQQKYVVAMSGNSKEGAGKQTGEDKRCSERGAIDYLLAKAPDALIVGMVVASKETGTEPGAVNNNKTLHCCEECRAMLSEKHCVNKDAPILTVNHAGETDIIEEMPIRDMLGMYDKRRREKAA